MASTWNAAFELAPANTDNVSAGDDEIRTDRSATRERMDNEHTTYVADSTAGAVAKDWLHLGGSAVGLLQNAAPATRLSGEALGATSRDKGYIWFDDDNADLFYIWTGAAFALPGIAIPSCTSDPVAPVTGQIWFRTDV